MNNIFSYISQKINTGHPRSILAKKNILATLLLKGVSILVNLAYVPVLIHTLGKEEYGIWLVLSSFVSWMNFFDIGIANGLRNKLGQALAVKDFPLARTYISTTYAIISIIFIPVAILSFSMAGYVNWQNVFNSALINTATLQSLTSITLSFFALRFIVQIIGVVLLADQKPAYNSLINVLISIIGLVVIILLKKAAIASLYFVGSVISLIPLIVFITFSIFLYSTAYKHIRPKLKFINFKYAKSLFGLGIYFFVIQISGLIIFSSTNLIITQFFSPSEVTVYNIAFKYFSIITMVFGIIITPLWSAITDAYTTGDFDWIRRSIDKFKMLAMGLTVVTFVMLAFSNVAYKTWIGNTISVPFSLSLAVSLQIIVTIFWSPYVTFLNGTGKIRLVCYLVIIQCMVYIPIVYLLVKTFKISVAAIILASIIAELPIRIIQPIQYLKIINHQAKGIWNK